MKVRTQWYLLVAVFLVLLLTVYSCTQPVNKPPVWTEPSYTVNGTVGQMVSFDLAGKVSDPDGDPVTVTIAQQPSGANATISNNKLTFTPASEGTYNFVLKASDGKGGEALAGLVVIVSKAPNAAPVWTKTAYSASAVVGRPFEFDLAGKVSDPDGDAITITIVRAPNGITATIADNKLKFTPPAVGTYEFTLKASDGKGGEAEAGLVVVVSAVPNAAPVWTKTVYSASAVVGQPFEFDLTGKVSDPDGDPVTISIVSGPTGATISGSKLKFTPAGVAVYEFELKATDGKGGESYAALVVVGTKTVVTSEYSANLRVYVTAYKSGWAVEDAIIQVFDSNENLIAAGLTNNKGFVDIPVPLSNPVDFVNVLVEKDGHAKTYIEGLRLVDGQSFQFETQARVAKLGKTKSKKPFNLNVTVLDGNGNPLTNNVVTTSTIRVVGTVQSLEYTFNLWYVKVGGVPGTSLFTSPRAIGYDGNINATQSVTAFDGLTPIFIDVYDQNDNRYEKIIYINVSRPPVSSITPYIVQQVTSGQRLTAITRRTFVEYYGSGKEEPTAAPKDTNLYVIVRWRAWATGLPGMAPKGYKIYRSFDGVTYEPIGLVAHPTSTFYDYSTKLEPMKRVWYAVSSLYDGGYETPYTVIGNVVPLPMFDVEYIYPKNGTTNVSRDPTFRWRFVGPSTTPEGNVTYVWDIWILDFTVNDNAWYSLGINLTTSSSFALTPAVAGTSEVQVKFSDYTNPSSTPRWVDYIGGQWYPYNKLQANKTYQWGNRSLIAYVFDSTDNTVAWSIYCDELNRTGLGLGTIRAEIYHRFVTGEN